MKYSILILSVICFMNTSCNQLSEKSQTNINQQTIPDWKETLLQKLPLLGHRNWIVVTDMAYPLQTKEGITTLFADEPYEQVVATIINSFNDFPHVLPVVYQDLELNYVQEELCPGIETFRKQMSETLAGMKVSPVKHEELIARLDSVSAAFQIIIIKTNLTMPFTSTFFELDCKYWDAEKQALLQKHQNELTQ